MKADKPIATYRRLRDQPVWRLLAADNGPVVIGLLTAHFYEADKSLPASTLHERIGRDLEELRAQGETLPQTAQGYVSDWLAAGFLERRFPAGASEEEYELSSAAIDAIRFVAGLVDRRPVTTESRLATVIQQLVQLAAESDTDPQTRIAALLREREHIDLEIDSVQQGRLKALPEGTALERIREIIVLADDLAGDFRHVRDDFEKLNRDLREQVMRNEGSRGEILDALFAGVDLIAESEAGKTFAAFWRLLTDPEQSATVERALDQVMSRDFAAHLDTRERRFLLRLTGTLLDEGGIVHEVLQSFARSLKHFVQSREYLEQRRLSTLLREAQRSAITIKDQIRVADGLAYSLQLTSSRLRSLSQWVLYDPSKALPPGGMAAGETALIDLKSISELVADSEIDFRTLRHNIRAALQNVSQISIGDVLVRYPAAQGLGSVVGLLALASRHAIRIEGHETVSWFGRDEQQRSARIPTMYFLRERSNDLV